MKKSLKIASIMGALLVVSTTSYAWITVHDIQNEIKQALEHAKVAEITNKVKTIKDNMAIINQPLANLAAISEDIHKSIDSLQAFKHKTTGILNDEKNSIKDLYKLKLDDEARMDDLKNESKRLDAMQQKEIIQTISTANDTSEAAAAIQEEMQKVLKEHSEGLISEQQKNILLKSLQTRMNNVTSMNEAQAAANQMAADARNAAEEKTTAVIGKQYEFTISGSDQKEAAEKSAASRIQFP